MLGMRSYIGVSIVVVNERKQEQTMKDTCRKYTRPYVSNYHGEYSTMIAVTQVACTVLGKNLLGAEGTLELGHGN